MTNPNNAVGTDGAYGGRTSVNAFNDNLAQYSRGVLNGWDIAVGGGMSVEMGGNGTDRDVAVAEDNAGNKTTINNISASPINVPIATAHATNDRLDVIVAYVDNPPTGNSTDVDNPGACGIIAVAGVPASTPIAPDDAAIRTAITADGASGATAYYVVLRTIIVKAGVTVIDSSAWVISTLVPEKPWANVRGNRFIAPGTITNPLLSQNAVRSSNIDWATLGFANYRSVEQDTGFTWLNGETIYSKTITIGALPNSATKTVAHGISNLSGVIKIEGIVLDPRTSIWLPLPLVYEGDSSDYNVSVYVSSTLVAVKSTSDRSMLTPAYVTIYYTKSS